MNDPECTDCGGTGMTYQTERRCSCQMSDIVDRLRQYEGDISQTTMCYNGTREEAAAEIQDLRAALVANNDMLRSAYQIAKRDGFKTNWRGFLAGCNNALVAHHDITSSARDAVTRRRA